jgi:hypothetical protein
LLILLRDNPGTAFFKAIAANPCSAWLSAAAKLQKRNIPCALNENLVIGNALAQCQKVMA